MGLPLLSHKIAHKFWTTMTWAVYDGDVPVMLALRSLLGWRTTAWILMEHGVGPEQCSEMEAQSWVSQQRGSVGHTDGEMGR